MGDLLKLQYGYTDLPTISTASNGTMFVQMAATGSSAVETGVLGAKLYFDLNNQRFTIVSSIANSTIGTLALKLGSTTAGTFNGSSNTVWTVPLASTTVVGLMSTAAQEFAGIKTFSNGLIASAAITAANIIPSSNARTLGSSTSKWQYVYATTFVGTLSGTAGNAVKAGSVANYLNFYDSQEATTASKSYNGSGAVSIRLSDLVADKIPLEMIPQQAIERIYDYASLSAATTAVAAGDIQAGDIVRIVDGTDGKLMYYVSPEGTLTDFVAGVAAVANRVANSVNFQIMGDQKATYNGGETATFNVPAANTATAGVISTAAQTFKGKKTFNDGIAASSTSSFAYLVVTQDATMHSINPATTNVYSLGSTTLPWKEVHATTFNGALNGVAAKSLLLEKGLTLKLGTTSIGTFKGASDTTWTIPLASTTVVGLMDITAQSFAGVKTFSDGLIANAAITAQNIVPSSNARTLGTSTAKWQYVYAATFVGALSGTASNAVKAGSVEGYLTFTTNGSGLSATSYNGSSNVTISTFKGATSTTGGGAGFVPGPGTADVNKVLRGNGAWASLTGATGISVSVANTGFTIGHSNAKPTTSVASAAITSGTKFYADRVTMNDQGHITALATQEYTATVTALYAEGDKIATILGVDIWSGIEWKTF